MENLDKIFLVPGMEKSPAAEEDIKDKLSAYMDSVLKTNRYMNMTAITDKDEFIDKHYVDSLSCSGLDEFKEAEKIIDVGTGAGFPGVPLAAAFPDKEFMLTDSLDKRIRTVKEICEELSIDNVKTIHGRAEDLAHQEEMREKFDLCLARAVANMSALAEYCLPFVKTGGTFIAYKGPKGEKELADAVRAIELLGGEIDRIHSPTLKGHDPADMQYDHKLIVIKKIKNTPDEFPRKAGTPSKEPIR